MSTFNITTVTSTFTTTSSSSNGSSGSSNGSNISNSITMELVDMFLPNYKHYVIFTT